MTKFKLPPGYSFEPPADHPSVLIPGEKLYGGADPSDAWDAADTHWTFCNATGPDGLFRFRAFAMPKGETAYTERKLHDSVDGRGNADVQWKDGIAHYTAWQKDQFYQNAVEGFVAWPSIPELDNRITALELDSGGVPGAAHPIAIPLGGAIAVLWPYPYGAAEVDTPEEVAIRLSKLKAAFIELVGLLKAAGVVV